jgi:hypothetical protein
LVVCRTPLLLVRLFLIVTGQKLQAAEMPAGARCVQINCCACKMSYTPAAPALLPLSRKLYIPRCEMWEFIIRRKTSLTLGKNKLGCFSPYIASNSKRVSKLIFMRKSFKNILKSVIKYATKVHGKQYSNIFSLKRAALETLQTVIIFSNYSLRTRFIN